MRRFAAATAAVTAPFTGGLAVSPMPLPPAPAPRLVERKLPDPVSSQPPGPVCPSSPERPALPVVRPLLGGPKHHGEKRHAEREHKHEIGNFMFDEDRFGPSKRHKTERDEPNGRSRGGGSAHPEGIIPVIKPTLADDNRVVRSYRSNPTILQSGAAGTQDTGGAFSFAGTFNGVTGSILATINAGGPANGTPIAGLVFENLVEEYLWFTNVFQYAHLKKLQLNITRMAGNTNTIATSDDPGVVCVRPWAGQTGEANYTTGVLSTLAWTDHFRRKVKKEFHAMSKVGPQIMESLCTTPISVQLIPEEAQDGTAEVQYVPTEAVERGHFNTGVQDHNSFGFIVYWYHPGLNATANFELLLDWEIEFEFYGLQQPVGLAAAALPDGSYYSDDVMSLLPGVTVVQRPQPPPTKMAGYCNPYNGMKKLPVLPVGAVPIAGDPGGYYMVDAAAAAPLK